MCKISIGAFFEYKIQEEGEVSLVFLFFFFLCKMFITAIDM